jgi:hypothetical protein
MHKTDQSEKFLAKNTLDWMERIGSQLDGQAFSENFFGKADLVCKQLIGGMVQNQRKSI